jgi:hypothetical protein
LVFVLITCFPFIFYLISCIYDNDIWAYDTSQVKQDKRDYLTDSESDDEDYAGLKPSLERARRLLAPPQEDPATAAAATGGKDKSGKDLLKDKKGAPPPTPVVEVDDESFVLGEEQRNEEQVELLRDRKTLDLDSTILKARKGKLNAFAAKLAEVSAHSKCLLQALPLQMPFHRY